MSRRLCGGHTEAALCVAVDDDGRVLSGGEHAEFCMWSPDGAAVQRMCLPGVQCDVTSIVTLHSRPHEAYVAGGTHIFHYDTRHLSSPLSAPLAVSDDEINELALDADESQLAAADDSGAVTLVADGVLHRTLKAHQNICATVAYRGAGRQGELVSGGYDGMMLQWDVLRTRCYARVSLRDFGVAAGEAPPLTPPFVHSVAMSPDGQWVAAGTENALVEVFNARQRTVTHHRTLIGHTRGVSRVHFPQDDLLLSGGNDGRVLLWRLSTFSGAPLSNGHGKTRGRARRQGTADRRVRTPHATFNHGAKVNWIASGRHANQDFFVVADNTPNLTVYPLTG